MPGLIDTSTMPGDKMSPGLIEAAATNFRAVGTKVSTRGGIVLARWQKIAGVYDAPEDETLVQSMDPVKTKAEAFDKDLDTTAKALDTFADQVRTVKAEVVKIRAEAAALLGGITDGKVTKTYYGGGDYYTEPFDWHTDQATVDANNALIRRTNDQQEALWAAERACASAIRAAVGLSPVRARDSANPKGYGSLEVRDDAPMPWGRTVDRTESCLEHVGEGVVFDGAGGVISGLGNLGGFSYSDDEGLDWASSTAGDTAGGILLFAAGAATIGPVGLAAAHATPGPVGRFLRNAQLSVAAGVGGLVALDLYAKDPLHKWKDNSARAGGETLFNVATFAIAPLKAVKLGRGGRPDPDTGDAPPSDLVPPDADVGDSAPDTKSDTTTQPEQDTAVDKGSSAGTSRGIPPDVRADVDDAIRRAAEGKPRFQKHDGKRYLNSDGLLPTGVDYSEWTAAPNGAKRGAHRVIIAGKAANPEAIYYWDHVNPPVRIGP